MKTKRISKEINTQDESIIVYNKDGSFNRIKILKNIFKTKEESIPKIVKKHIKKYIGEYTYIIESGQKVYFDKALIGEYTYSNSTKNLNILYKLVKGRAVIVLKEMINYAKCRTWEHNQKYKHRTDAKYGFYRYNTVFSFEYNGKEQIYQGIILIRNDCNGKKYLYDVLKIKK